MTLENEVKEIERKCLNGEISPLDAVNRINSTIGGITAVYFKYGLKFKIDNHKARFKMRYNGLRNYQDGLSCDLAVLAYYIAKKNGSIFPGEVHIGPKASTKHYMSGINEILARYLPN